MADHGRRIERVQAHIAANLDGDLSLDALAEVAAMSRFHWHRVFRAMTGETVAEAVRRARLSRAAELVAGTDCPLSEVARRCGYADAASLSRAFRAAWGIPPGAARAAGGRLPPLPQPPTEKGLPMTPVDIRHYPPVELAGLLHRGPYDEIGRTFARLCPPLDAAGVPYRGPGYAVYHDGKDVPRSELRSHAAIVIDPGTPLPSSHERLALPGGRVAILTHRGPYDGIAGAWDALYRWLEQSGEAEADAAPYDRYLNGPEDTAPENLLTELCLPLRG
jgi:AraC family transcriptional regulator